MQPQISKPKESYNHPCHFEFCSKYPPEDISQLARKGAAQFPLSILGYANNEISLLAY